MAVVMEVVVMAVEAMDFMAVDSTAAACAPVTFTAEVDGIEAGTVGAGIEAGAAVASIMATVFTITAASTAAATTRATIITAAAE
jgi:hypothetical protein